MPQKRYRPEEIIAKLRQADVLLGEGKKLPEVVKALAIHEVTYYRWRRAGSRSHGPRTWSARTPACAERSPTSPSTSSSSHEASRKLLSPSRRRRCIQAVCEGLHVSERRACRALGQHRFT
jgi:putative transposase